MNISLWNSKNCVSISAEDLRQNQPQILSYIRANPNKIYLFPEGEMLSSNNSDFLPCIAEEIHFPCAVKFFGANGELQADSLSEILEQELSPTKNFLILPQNHWNLKNKILQQFSLLKIPLEIYSEDEFKIVAAKNSLAKKSAALIAEIDNAKSFLDEKFKIKNAQNISMLENFFGALEELKRFLTAPAPSVKIAVLGDQNLTEILKILNFDATNCNDKNFAGYDAVIFAVDAYTNFSIPENILSNDKIIFVINTPALSDEKPDVNLAAILEKMNGHLFFLIEAANIFYDEKILNFAQDGGNLSDVEGILSKFELTGRDRFFLSKSLEKFLNSAPHSNEEIFQKTGVPCLVNYLRGVNREILAENANLFSRINKNLSLLDYEIWQKFYHNQIKNLKTSEQQVKILYEKVLSINERAKIFTGGLALKSLLYDAEKSLNDFIFALEEMTENLIENIAQVQEISEDSLSFDTKNLAADLNSAINQAVKNFRANAEDFLSAANSVFNISAENLPEKNFACEVQFDKIFSECLSAQNLQRIQLQNTKMLCLENSSQNENWKDFLRDAKVEKFLLVGSFRRALIQNLHNFANKKIAAIKENLRQKILSDLIEYFNQVSKICDSYRLKIVTAFNSAAQEILNDKSNLENDAQIIENFISNFKNLMKLRREIFTCDDAEILNFETAGEDFQPPKFSTAEMFSTQKISPRKIKTQNNSDAAGKFDLAKRFLDNKNYEKAFELFAELAAGGNSEATAYLAYMYQEGRGTERNLREAIKYYLDAFYLGNAASAGELGDIFQDAQNFSRALEWYNIGAEHGDKYSQDILK